MAIMPSRQLDLTMKKLWQVTGAGVLNRDSLCWLGCFIPRRTANLPRGRPVR